MKGTGGKIECGLMATGAIGLMGATVTDGVAVIGRHSGIPLHGSLELVQTFVTVAAGSAIAFASLSAMHATVDLLFDRFPPALQALAHRMVAILAFLFMAALVGGSMWIALEYWNEGERTELLGIEIRWLRLFWVACAIVSAVAVVTPAFRPHPRLERSPPDEGA